MASLDKLDQLMTQVRQHQTPVFNVADQVIQEIVQRDTVPITPFSLVAGISAAAAVVTLFYAVQAWVALNGSLVDYFDPSVLETFL